MGLIEGYSLIKDESLTFPIASTIGKEKRTTGLWTDPSNKAGFNLCVSGVMEHNMNLSVSLSICRIGIDNISCIVNFGCSGGI